MEDERSLERDSQITRLDASTYAATLTKPFCVGTVPNGGYIASIYLRVAGAFLGPRGQPDPIAAHWQFLAATEAGRAVFVVEEAKPGRGTSVIHVALYQGGLLEHSPWITPESKKRSVAYITNSLLDGEQGITLSTMFAVRDPPPPVDLDRLVEGRDAGWEKLYLRIMDYVPMLKALEIYAPRNGPVRPATYDFWLRLANGERFNNASLGFVSDTGPPFVVESFRPSGPETKVPEGGFAYDKIFWYPTLTMSMDIKKALPVDGEEWLRLRAEAKMLKNGRYDSEVIIFDVSGDIVALSNHVALAVDVERNYARAKKL